MGGLLLYVFYGAIAIAVYKIGRVIYDTGFQLLILFCMSIAQEDSEVKQECIKLGVDWQLEYFKYEECHYFDSEYSVYLRGCKLDLALLEEKTGMKMTRNPKHTEQEHERMDELIGQTHACVRVSLYAMGDGRILVGVFLFPHEQPDISTRQEKSCWRMCHWSFTPIWVMRRMLDRVKTVKLRKAEQDDRLCWYDGHEK